MADVEPVYEYKKGEGWVVAPPRRPFPHNKYDLICKNCGRRAGEHRIETFNCPNPAETGRRTGTHWSDETWA